MPHRRKTSRWLISLAAVVAAMAIVVVVAFASGGGGTGSSTAAAKISVKPAQLIHPRTPGRVLFVSDFESQGFPEWYVQALPDRATLVHGHAYEGHSNARFEVRPGDVEPDTGSQRAEVSGPTYHEGQDLYVRTAFRVPAANSFQGNWQLIQQFHEDNWGGSPGTAVFLTPDRHFEIGHGDSSQIDWRSPKIKDERWYELVYRVKFSRRPEGRLRRSLARRAPPEAQQRPLPPIRVHDAAAALVSEDGHLPVEHQHRDQPDGRRLDDRRRSASLSVRPNRF